MRVDGAGSSTVVTLRERSALALWAAFVGVLPWLWHPGLVAPDTKLDLSTNPWGYLARSLTAWDGRAGFGQLQNQAYGYLFPMGPVFGVGHSLGVPEWAVQRAWWSIILVVAFLGAEKALRVLGGRGGLATAIPALAYALSPRALTVLSEISVEAWPAAVCPWLVVVLARALRADATTTDRARMAVGTGLLMAVMGGVNAAASLLVVLVPAMLLLTSPAEVGRLRTAAWWLLGVGLGSLWWFAPLVVLGLYAFPFLDFIESASVTTSVTSVPNVLRGTSHWVAFLVGPDRQPQWQSGWILVQNAAATIGTLGLVALGTAGLLARRPLAPVTRNGLAPDHVKRFALLTLLLGVALMSAGHSGRFGGGFAQEIQHLLDGPFAAFRNVHKADPLVRLPLVIGLSWILQLEKGRFVDWVWAERTDAERAETWRRWLVGGVVTALAAAVLPVWQGRVVSAGAFTAIPRHWQQAAAFVDEAAEADGGSTLLLPGSRSAVYSWGRTDDEPLSALAASPVMVRDAVSLGAPEATRILDVVDLMAASGTRQLGLATTLSRMGVARVVVRHDLAWQALAEDPALVERTLARSPGFSRVLRLGRQGAAVSIWKVAGPHPPVTAYPAERVLRVFGGPEALATLDATGVEHRGRVVMIGDDVMPDIADSTEERVSTDTLRRRWLNKGRPVADAYSQTLDRRAEQGSPETRDLPPAGEGDPQTERVWLGLDSVTASDEASDPFEWAYRGPQAGAFAAIDGDPDTAWLSAGDRDVSRIVLEFAEAVPATTLRLDLADDAGVAELERVTVTAGGLEVDRDRPGGAVAVPLAGSTGSEVEIELERRGGSGGRLPVGVSEISIDGHLMGTAVRAASGRSDVSRFVLFRDPRQRLEPERSGEDGASLDRMLVARRPSEVVPDVSVVARNGAALEAILDAPWTVTASSRVGQGPSNRPGAAIDGSDDSRWIAEVSDLAPRLELRAASPQLLSSLSVEGGDRKRIAAIDLRAGRTTIRLGRTGGSFAPLRTRELTVTFRLRDSDAVFRSPELDLGSTTPDDQVRLRCGDGGALQVGGQVVLLEATTSRRALLEGTPAQAEPCGDEALVIPSGSTFVRGLPGPAVQARSIVLSAPAGQQQPSVTEPRLPEITAWSTDRRSFQVEPSTDAQVVVLHESFNRGWVGALDGDPIEPVRIDGWRQGFVVPAGEGGHVEAVFAPSRWYSAGLVAGGVSAAVLLLAMLVLWRRPSRVAPAAEPPRRSARSHPAVVMGASAGGLLAFAVGGLAGVLAYAAVGITLVAVRGCSPALLAFGVLLASGPLVVTLRWLERADSGRDLAQLLGLVAVSVLTWSLVLPRAGDDLALHEEVGERGD